jgi:glycerol uptake facilitator-like aquaporin
MVFAASFGHISGVHFNPAVTVGVLIAGDMQAVMAILYVVMQLLGGKNFQIGFEFVWFLFLKKLFFRYCCWWYFKFITY